jgi:hypothetical protein
MRSGVMDQLALLGIPIVSIDISPHGGLADGKLPDLATSKGWDRGLKLEDSYKQNYGHAFVKHERADEKKRNLPAWKGEFHPDDVATIGDAVEFYLGAKANKANSDNYRHQSHPLQPAQVRAGLDHLVQFIRKKTADISAYALIDHLHPYVNQLTTLVTSTRGQEGKTLSHLLSELKHQIDAMVGVAEAGQPKGIKWMRDNQKQALLNDDPTNQWYAQQKPWIAAAFGMGADEAVERYKALDHHYRQPVDANGLSLILRFVEAIEKIQALTASIGMTPQTSSTSQ